MKKNVSRAAGLQQADDLSTREETDAYEPSAPQECSQEDIARWNREWLKYLEKEWTFQLAPYTRYPDTPPLPEDPEKLLDHTLGWGPPLAIHCDRHALKDRRVMELGCGCGNLGKLLARYVTFLLGADYSTLALTIARLVSPDNCSYIHVADASRLQRFHGQIDTVVSRHFWIHQNSKLARLNLEFLLPFLVDGGRIYADFFWPDPERKQRVVFAAHDPLSRTYPSATFEYSMNDVHQLVDGLPLVVARQATVSARQRRYVVFEKR